MEDVEDVLALTRLLVAVPFVVGGVRRAAGLNGDPGGSRPRRALAACLAVAEILVAFGLMHGPTAWWSAVLALACLAAQILATRGDPVPALRAFTLAVPALAVIWLGWADSGPDIASWLSGLTAGQLAAVLAFLAAIGFVSARTPPPAPTPTPAPAPQATTPTAATLIHAKPELTIGMATYDDFDGVYFTLQALRLYHDLDRTELLVVDNHGCTHTRDFVRHWARGRYVLATDVVGTAAAKDLVFRNASAEAVLCCDSHVLFEPGAIARLKRFYRENPDCADLLQGPLLYDDGRHVSTHFDPVWRDQMWGVWATDARGLDSEAEPFEIPMQGLGVFSCRTESWLGFHPGFRGFGGEEGYIHVKFQQAGRRCLCLPWLRWMHRFGRPHGVPYPLTVEDKLRNYLLGHAELGLDPAPVLSHFAPYLPAEQIRRLVDELGSDSAARAAGHRLELSPWKRRRGPHGGGWRAGSRWSRGRRAG